MKRTPYTEERRGWPHHLLWGRMRASTLVLLLAFVGTWWVYDTYRPPVPTAPATQVVPPGYVPDPAYTWVPRTNVATTTTPTTTTTTPTTTPAAETTTPTESPDESPATTTPDATPTPTTLSPGATAQTTAENRPAPPPLTTPVPPPLTPQVTPPRNAD